MTPIKSTKDDWRPPDMFRECLIPGDSQTTELLRAANLEARAWLFAAVAGRKEKQ